MVLSSAQNQQDGYRLVALPELPYAKNALEPYLSAETIEYHYGKHHKKYVDTLNGLIEHSQFEKPPLEEIIRQADGTIFNNAAQVWNHTFYWNGFSPDAEGRPTSDVDAVLRDAFGSFEEFKQQFEQQCTALFGSGWVWLVKDQNNQFNIETGKDADNPLREGKMPILTCDMWEHAYYIDYRNDKQAYLDAFWKIVDWHTVARRIAGHSPV